MGKPNVEEPVTRVGNGITSDTVTTHPAFAQIGASRVSGHANLYDSDFTHNAYMTIRVSASQLNRSLNRDWHYSPNLPMIEVALSEAQWATFVSAPNMGSGVPCTLQSFDGKQVPQLPPPVARHDQFNAELQESLSEALAKLKALESAIGDVGLSKAKADKLHDHARAAIRAFTDTVPFVVNQFDEHAEGTIEKAKAEVHGYMTGVIQRAGLDAIGAIPTPLQIEQERMA